MTDLIRRADVMGIIDSFIDNDYLSAEARMYSARCALSALPSADVVSREDYHNLLTASNDIDRALREYQAKEEQLSAEVEPKIDHDRDWIIGCIEHDGFIHTDRFDKANQIIHDALSADTSSDLISRANAIRWVKTECNPYGKPTLEFESGKRVIEHLEQMPSADPETKWIPCSERLPKECEYINNVCKYYLIQDEYGDMHVAHLCRRGWETIESTKALGCDVVAWMPLPKPYREDGEE